MNYQNYDFSSELFNYELLSETQLKKELYKNNPVDNDQSFPYQIHDRFKFIIMAHKSRKSPLHYDFRFESNDHRKLLSWALVNNRKEIDVSNITKLLQIETNYHPLSFLSMTGTKKYNPNDFHKVQDFGYLYKLKYSNDKILLNIHGTKINGLYALIRVDKLPVDEYESKWIFMKQKRDGIK